MSIVLIGAVGSVSPIRAASAEHGVGRDFPLPLACPLVWSLVHLQVVRDHVPGMHLGHPPVRQVIGGLFLGPGVIRCQRGLPVLIIKAAVLRGVYGDVINRIPEDERLLDWGSAAAHSVAVWRGDYYARLPLRRPLDYPAHVKPHEQAANPNIKDDTKPPAESAI